MAENQRTQSPRPESTIAQNFAADLDSMFGLSPEMEKLTQTVQEKKQTVSSGEQELQELEARLKAAEQRLAKVSRNPSPAPASAPPRPPPPAPALGGGSSAAPRAPPVAQRQQYPTDPPPPPQGYQGDAQTRYPPPIPGSMPPDPSTANGSEYVMVDRNPGQQSAQRGYG